MRKRVRRKGEKGCCEQLLNIEYRTASPASLRTSSLERVLNQHAEQGWQVKAITAVEVKGRIGPGGVEGVLVTFERQIA